MARLALLLIAALPAASLAGDLVGPEGCKACHRAAWESWRETAHARAQESLPARNRRDPRCTPCHSPDQDKGVAGVSCEACHGPGQAYSVSYVMRDAELARAVGLVVGDEKTCLSCHTDSTPSLGRFVYRRALELIRHSK